MIYFAQAEPDSPIKIGCSTAPELRIRQLTIDTKSPMRLLLVVPGGKPQEAYISARLSKHLVSPEWFRCCGDVLVFIAECRAARCVVGFVSEQHHKLRKDVSIVADWDAIHEMRARRAQGWTLAQIGRERGISRQAVQQTLAYHFPTKVVPASPSDPPPEAGATEPA